MKFLCVVDRSGPVDVSASATLLHCLCTQFHIQMGTVLSKFHCLHCVSAECTCILLVFCVCRVCVGCVDVCCKCLHFKWCLWGAHALTEVCHACLTGHCNFRFWVCMCAREVQGEAWWSWSVHSHSDGSHDLQDRLHRPLKTQQTRNFESVVADASNCVLQ